MKITKNSSILVLILIFLIYNFHKQSFRTKDANGNISIKKVPDTKITNVSTVQSNKGINRNDEGNTIKELLTNNKEQLQ